MWSAPCSIARGPCHIRKEQGLIGCLFTERTTWSDRPRFSLYRSRPRCSNTHKRIKEKQPEEPENTATVLYIGHIPHGFYEDQMQGFFQQFGAVKRVRISRNRKTGKSKHYGYIEFENPEVAKIVADEMNNYLLYEHTLQIALVPPEKVHAKLWKGVRKGFVPIDRVAIERKKLSKDKTVEEHKRMLEGIVKRDEKRRKRIKAAGIDYECPALVGFQPSAKKIKFDED